MEMEMDIELLIKKVLDCAIVVREALGAGFLEKVYERALIIELESVGIKAISQQPIEVRYKGHVIGEFVADIIVENCLILEIKSVENIVDAHEVQLVNYLTATGFDNGLIINFGNLNRIQIKRKFRVYQSTS